MKACLNAWTVDPGVGFAEMFAQLREAGFDGVELNVDAPGRSAHSLTMDTTARELARIRALAEQSRLAVVSVSSSLHGDNMGAADPENVERLIQIQRRMPVGSFRRIGGEKEIQTVVSPSFGSLTGGA